MRKIHINYGDYQLGEHVVEGEDFAFQNEDTKGWVTRADVEGKVEAVLAHFLDTLQPGDKLSITIEVLGKDDVKP
jgi:hypothetical protein